MTPLNRLVRSLWRFIILAALGVLLSWQSRLLHFHPESLVLTAPPQAHAELPATLWAHASFPVAKFESYSSPWGWRTDPFTGKRKLHRGLDITGPVGSPIVAWWSGTVTMVTSQPDGCGNYVLIQSGKWEHLYCHNQDVLVREGDTVQVGQTIATLGSTGRSSGPHCHFELWYDGENLDPANVLRAMYQAEHAGPTSSYPVPAPLAWWQQLFGRSLD